MIDLHVAKFMISRKLWRYQGTPCPECYNVHVIHELKCEVVFRHLLKVVFDVFETIIIKYNSNKKTHMLSDVASMLAIVVVVVLALYHHTAL